MEGSDFDDLFAHFPTTIRWEASHPCPCIQPGGGANRQCPVCSGSGYWFDPLSDPFEAAIIGQDARARAAMAQTMGPGEMGDAVFLVPRSALCYSEIRERDRIYDTMRIDKHRVPISASTPFHLPWGVRDIEATAFDATGTFLERVSPPLPDENRKIFVTKTTTLEFFAPRAYQILRDLAKVRTFGADLPKRFSVRLIDLSVR